MCELSSGIHLRINVDIDLRCIGEKVHIVAMKHLVPQKKCIFLLLRGGTRYKLKPTKDQQTPLHTFANHMPTT